MRTELSRIATVVLSEDGEPLGAVDQALTVPWWSDVTELSELYPGLAVLRLLEAPPHASAPAGGEVVYVAELLEASSPRARRLLDRLVPWTGELHGDPLRMPWADSGGPHADLLWAGMHAEITGLPMQHRTWNLSSIWSVPAASGRLWLKCVPSFLGHEARVLEALAGAHVPRVIAADGCRSLLSDLPGQDGYGATDQDRGRLIDVLVELQMSTVGRADELVGLGVPDWRWPTFLEACEGVVARRAPDDRWLRGLLDGAAARVAAIEECGLPAVLVHGDAHTGNARIGPGTGRGVWFDWGDSKVASPVMDLAVLARLGARDAATAEDHWLRAWARTIPGSDPRRAWLLAEPLALLGTAVVFQGFLDRIEPSERVYHEADVLPALHAASAMTRQGARHSL